MVRTDKLEYISEFCDGQDVLHLGCVGNEQTVDSDQWLHSLIHEVSSTCLGVDIDERGIEEMKQEGYDAIVEDAQNLSINERFDVIVAGEIIEHLPNPGGLFESAKDHLCKNGLLIITTPNPFALIRFVTYFSPIHNFSVFEEHVSWFDRITLRQFASRYGFTEKEYHYPLADTLGVTQLLYKLGFEKAEDDFIGVYRLN
jgi:2-polyprenyl-3-methyl-5-hydroxy-6-metoxy-1,4-benzoquinol methylase